MGDDDEAEIEDYLADVVFDEWRPTGSSIGSVSSRPDILGEYADNLVRTCCLGADPGLAIVIDCAHGAASEAAALVFGRCFNKADLISDRPDRHNINDGCGVIHIENVASRVLSGGYSLGMALDGDADRVLFVDTRGRVIDGDIILWVLARWPFPKESSATVSSRR